MSSSSNGDQLHQALHALRPALRGKKLLITGGCGFLGRHIANQAKIAGAHISVFDMRIVNYDPDINFIQGNLLDVESVGAAVRGHDLVIHVASPNPLSGNVKVFYAVNVDGSKTLIAACRREGVRSIVYTSSASVVFDGTDQLNFTEENAPPSQPMDAYTGSKLAAERVLLEAGDSTLAVCALRPHGIFGPHDPHLVPNLAAAGAAGKSKYIIGDGSNLSDFTYVENVAFSHVLAASKLTPESVLNKQAYFITNAQPVLFWDFFTTIYDHLGYKRPHICMPVTPMYGLGAVAEYAAKVLPFKPTFTRQRVVYAGRHHYYSPLRAREHMGYVPPISLEEGLRRTLEHFEDMRAPDAKQKAQAREAARTDVISDTDGGLAGWHVLALIALVLAAVAHFVPGLVTVASLPAYALPLAVALLAFRSWYISQFGSSVRMFPSSVSLNGKTALVTGGNKGIGRSTAELLARAGARVIIACRNESRAQQAVAEMTKTTGNPHIEYVVLDLSKLESVRACVQQVKKSLPQIDYLINNAGVMVGKDDTDDGHDMQVQVNHLGPFLLTNSLLEQECLSDAARIVNVTSMLYQSAQLDLSDLNVRKPGASYNRVQVYGNTKLMNVLFANELNRRFTRNGSNKRAISVHPGAVNTDFINHFIPAALNRAINCIHKLYTITPHQSAQTVAYAAAHPDVQCVGGVYISNSRVERLRSFARDAHNAERLWKESERLLRTKFDW